MNNLSRYQTAAIVGVVALVFVLVFAPAQISMYILSSLSSLVVLGGIVATIYFINQSMKKTEKAARKAVNELSAAVARTDSALKTSEKSGDSLVTEYFSSARRHLNTALNQLSDSEFADAERSAAAGKAALHIVLSSLGIQDETIPAPGAEPAATDVSL